MKAKAIPPIDKTTVEERRLLVNVYLEFQAPSLPVASVRDVIVNGEVPVRVYTPEGSGPFGALVFYHGGGWISGNLDLYDQPCRWLCHHGGVIVVSVDYRLAPERKFPGPLEDAKAALRWTIDTLDVDRSRIAVGGDSSGGNLAAAVALQSRELALQLLIYPVLERNFETASYREFAQGPMLTRGAMEACWLYYLANDGDAANPLAAPLCAPDLRGVPAACILTAECDPVRDDGEQYAARLKAANVPVQQIRYPGTTHALLNMTGRSAQARRMMDDASTALRQM